MWPPRLPPLPEMSEEVRQKKLAEARKKLREFQQQRGIGAPSGAKKKKKAKNGSSPETTTSDGHSPEDSASFVNGEGLASSANIKALESRYQELSLALDSSNLTNKQLSSEIEELKRQNQEIADQLEKEKQEYKQKLAKEQGALREQLQVHIQTIGILVSEKTELQTALAHTQQAARQKTGEAEDLAGLLQSSQQRVGDLERTLCAVSTQQKQADRFSSQSETPDRKEQLQQALEERAQLETHVEQLKELLKQLQMERDQYAENLKEENAIWQQKMQQMSEQVCKLREEKEQSVSQVQELETSLAELRNQIAVPPPQEPPAGPSEAEEQLQARAEQLQQELEVLTGQLRAQIQDNESLSRLNQEQGQRLLELEQEAERWGEQAEMRKQILEDMQSDRTTISRALAQNRELKEQLAELQDSFVRLTNENMEITSTLQTEQYVKKELAKKLGQLQERLGELKETGLLEAVNQQNQQLQAQLSLMALPGEGDGLDGEEMEEEAPRPKLSVPEDLGSREAMSRFTEVMQANVDLKERVEELEHRCIQLSGETDTIGDYITLYQNQRAVLKERHREKEEYISRLAKDKEEMKVKLLELQELVVRLVGERNEWYGRFLGAAQNPAGEPTTAPPAPQAAGAALSQGDLHEVSLADSAEPGPAALENSTAQQIMQLLCELQSPQEYPGLSRNPCIPFFYRADSDAGVKIMVI
ncbi:unnamed protein product [Pipistrellus nathusii]|uniref:Golgin subfamily A conserved domain-containing protein n=1 Tax=Pipistrellus nathusii TaxID=59473 RepID=A0ABN9Z5F9_PIPNA